MSDTCIVCLGDLGDGLGDTTQHPTIQQSSANHAVPIKRSNSAEAVPDLQKENVYTVARATTASKKRSRSPLTSPNNNNDEAVIAAALGVNAIAHLLPCGHNLHNECLKPWVERANSCPICRQSFNQVDLSTSLGGPTISSYAVSDRTQVADVDLSLVVDELYEEPDDRPCPVCGEDDHEEVLLACDGCNAYYHTYCIGLDEVPAGHWFCETCETQRAIDSVRPASAERPAPPAAAHHQTDRRTRAQHRRLRSHNGVSSSNWARVWQSVWDNLNLDLDFPYDDESDSAQAERAQQRRDFREWERRLRVAERQGGANRFRDTAPALLELRTAREGPQAPEPESQEELRAWNAFEKAKEIEADTAGRRKRKSVTTSPTENQAEQQPERPLKRPRTRRTVESSSTAAGAGASNAAAAADSPAGQTTASNAPTESSLPASASNNATTAAAPSFLQSMLKEIKSSSTPDGTTSPLRLNTHATSGNNASPGPTSPGSSPTSSNHASPRARSITPPPPSTSPRPMSPFSLTSRVEPIFAPAEFSPNRSPQSGDRPSSPSTDTDQKFSAAHTRVQHDHRQHPQQQSPPPQYQAANTSSPRATMPFALKADLQKMVSLALKPHYQRNVVTKEEYTEINRQVSHILYDRVGSSVTSTGTAAPLPGTAAGDASTGMAEGIDDSLRETFEKLAGEEVERAVRELREGNGIAALTAT